MFKRSISRLAASLLVAFGATFAQPEVASAAPAWIRNNPVLAVAEAGGFIQVQIATSGTLQWVSMPTTSSAPAARFLSAMTAAMLSGRLVDVQVDAAAANGCGNVTNCENILGFLVQD